MKILHISDIHFGYARDKTTGAKLIPIESAHVFSDKKTGRPKPEVLLELLKSNNNLVPPPELVIASGDIGWSADEEDYDLALIFFEGLRKAWPSSEICIIPGNHDVQLLGAITDDKLRQNNFFSFLRKFYPSSDLRVRFPLLTADEHSTGILGDREHLSYIHLLENNALVVGLNSAASIADFKSPILISNDHLDAVEKSISKLIRPYSPSNIRRIATIHHHVLPFVESALWTKGTYDPSASVPFDFTILSNSASFQEWLRNNRFDFVLHGHKHRFHAREDTLWTGKPGAPARSLAIVGAGSAGVNTNHVPRSEVNSFNILELYDISAQRTMLKTTTATYNYDGARPLAREDVDRFVTVGEPNSPNTWIFEGRDLLSCHRNIAARCSAGARLRNFMSVVESVSDRQFGEITTAQLGQRTATKIDFDLCFAALHPKWTQSIGWDDPTIGDMQDRCIAIQHGPRLFRRVNDHDGNPRTPLDHALRESPTRRYVGLYDAEIEIGSQGANLPGLVGLQFLPAETGSSLDIILTFRNIELSFWWVVNHLEGSRLLRWACDRSGEFTPGKIVVFSPFAEWLKDDPKPVMRIELETLSLTELLALVLGAFRSPKKGASKRLKEIVQEFRSRLNKNNIYVVGLENLCVALEAADRAVEEFKLGNQWKLTGGLIASIRLARDHLTEAIYDFDKRIDLVSRAQKSLDAALTEWP